MLPKGNGEDKYIIKFNTEDVLFSVERINSENNMSFDNREFEETLVKGIAVYYYELNGMYNAEFSISSYSYSLIACDRISLENIIIGLAKG